VFINHLSSHLFPKVVNFRAKKQQNKIHRQSIFWASIEILYQVTRTFTIGCRARRQRSTDRAVPRYGEGSTGAGNAALRQ
jgi:hypothetical protein